MAGTTPGSTGDWTPLGFVRVRAQAPVVAIADPERNAASIATAVAAAQADGVRLLVTPELSLTGYTCEDLFLGDDLHRRTAAALATLLAATAGAPVVLVVGAPLRSVAGRQYNAALVCHGGRVVAAVPKRHLPNAGEFYERRWFVPGHGVDEAITLPGIASFRLCADQLVAVGAAGTPGSFVLGVEVCEDLWAPEPPSGGLALAGATVIANPSASNELIAKADYRRELVRQQSARLHVAYVYAGAGPSESTKDVVFGGHTLVAANGPVVAEGERFLLHGASATADVDIEHLLLERARNITWSTAAAPVSTRTVVVDAVPVPLARLAHAPSRTPFVPDDPRTVDARAEEILAIQSTGLARRLLAARSERAVIGVSGGLDSTLALLVAVDAMRRAGHGPERIVGITMPGPGTTDGTRSAADELMARLGVEARTIPIGPAVTQHFADIGHDPSDHSVVFENAQARERTQILFDVANQVGGIVVGTGDLSELALGWCTYNADHMANYGVNAGVPKTLVRHLVRWYARRSSDPAVTAVLLRIADTVVSPELLPPAHDGTITQATEDLIGPYDLHDFFLFHTLRNGFAPRKVAALAVLAFDGTYDADTVLRWLRAFLTRFHRQQFKRTTLPPAPKVGSVSVSPRGDLRMPDEVDPAGTLDALG